MARRIPGEFVPLDVNMPHDIKVRRAGPHAELLYIRGLIYLKKAPTDGFIPKFDLPALSSGCLQVAKSVKALVTVGLWIEGEHEGVTGWYCVAWLKWNSSEAEKDEQRSQRRLGALKTNHDRGLHKEEPHDDCPKCDKEGERRGAPHPAPLHRAV